MSAASDASWTVKSRHAEAPVAVRVVNGVNPITTPALAPGAAGPWMWAISGTPVRLL